MPGPMLHAEKFEKLIDTHGRLVSWEEATMCSCWNLDSGQPTYSCRACNGKGFIYRAPIVAKAVLTSVTLSKEYADMAGVFEVGDAVMTVPKHLLQAATEDTPAGFIDNPMFLVGENDRITLLDDEFKTSEILARSIPVGHRDPDTLLNDHITSVRGVSSFDSVTGIETAYELEKDYRLNKNVIEWIDGGNAPEEGQQYSIVYLHKPVYTVVATLPKPRHQDNQDLPRYVALRYLSGAVDRQ